MAAPICAEAVLRGENSRLTNGTMWWLVAVGRLNPGWSMKRASAHLDSISAGIFQATLPANYPAESMKHYLGFKLAAYPAGAGLSQLRNDYAGSLWLLLGASGLLLLIACANLANLMLARASAREREIVVRLALGASRGRLLHQLLMESLLLAALGSLLGLWIARALSGVLISFLSINGDPVFLDLNLDWRVLGFNAGLAALTCLLFGMTSALRATGAEPGLALKTGAHTVTAGRERFSLRRILVVSQVSLSLVLLAGALLFSRSLRNLMTLDIGFRQNGVLLAGLDFTSLHLPAERRLEFKRQLLDRIRAIPGTKAAATLDIIPITGDSWSHDVWMDGPSSPQRLEVLFNRVSPDFFRTLEIPLVAGRTFDQEIAGGTKTAIVNEAFAQQLTNGANPVGKRFWREQTPSQPQALYEIVGLVKNTKYLDLREDFRPIVYLASSQDPSPDSSARVVLRSDLPPADITASVRRTVAEVNPGIVIDFDNLKTVIQGSLQRERLITTLSDFFGVLAVLLATMGLYGVISYIVARRTNEIGIRMALGADRTSVLRLIMREAVVLLVIGLGLGTTSALLAAKAAGNLLFGLKTNDPATFIMAAASLTLVTLAAGYFPAHRATKVDPMVALRQQ
ncbi:MAG TPA: ADOP family duplicated permease [Alphaproteobacteria bacterium]|nr:ADOP family duplicated permease [Alphaproteobacteria bacterium]